MTTLQQLHDQYGQSAWLDNLTRPYLRDGTMERFLRDGIRGVTANPTIFAKAISGSDAYDDQFERLRTDGASVRDAYWELVVRDIGEALTMFRPMHDASGGTDGFVSVEVDPELADDTDATIEAARQLRRRFDQPNVYVKIPATDAGIPAIEAMIAEGTNINITLIFSLPRYQQVIDAYQRGLERFAAGGGDVASVYSVASFFLSRVDTEVDRRLDAIGSDQARELRGRAAIAQAKLAYRVFQDHLDTDGWNAIAAQGATVQRPLWASTSTKNPAYRDVMYVESLIGPDTVSTLPEATIEAFEDHGTLARTVDAGTDEAAATIEQLATLGIDFDDVGATLEREGVASFTKSFDELLTALAAKSAQLTSR